MLSKKAAEQLKALAKDHNMSQADVIEYLVGQELQNKKKVSKKALSGGTSAQPGKDRSTKELLASLEEDDLDHQDDV